jgi:hypothetical protein
MNIKKTLASAIAAGAILVNAATPAFAATTSITISGNGRDSENTAVVKTSQTTSVVQSNNADVNNNVQVNADTGGNEIKDNSGGNSSIDTGNVSSNVEVSTSVNSNTAHVDCCAPGDTEVEISGNLRDSTNAVQVDNSRDTQVFQNNNADVDNYVKTSGNTGDNTIKDNSGGDYSIDTGNVSANVSVTNHANANVAMVHGSSEAGFNVSAKILGNGRDSDNAIGLDLSHNLLLVQSNYADIDNDVWVKGYTGDNEIKDNSGGEVMIDTGDVDSDVDVDNMVNFNWADVNCDCLIGDLEAKIAQNLEGSTSTIGAVLGGSTDVFQDNCGSQPWESLVWDWESDCEVDNDLHLYATTGDNTVKDTTDPSEGDPSIDTGDSSADVELDNSGNVNVVGDAGDVELPGLGFGVNLTFDLSDLLDLLNQS